MKTLVTVSSFLLFSIASFSQHSLGSQAMSIYNDVSELRFDNRSKSPLFIKWESNAFISKANAILLFLFANCQLKTAN